MRLTDDILAFLLALALHALGFLCLGVSLARPVDSTLPVLDVSSVELTLTESPEPGAPPLSPAAAEAQEAEPEPPEPEPPAPLPPPDPVIVQEAAPEAIRLPKSPEPELPRLPELPEPEPPKLPPLPEPPKPTEKPAEKSKKISAAPKAAKASAPSAPSPDQKGPADAGATGAVIAPVSNQRVIKPHYPRGARLRGEQGRVVMDCRVGTDGRVSQVTLVQSCGYPELDAAAIRAARFARFRPGTRNGVPVEATARLPIEFRLTDN